jgi:hypothetical protein
MLLYINGFWPGFSEKTNGIHYGFFEIILNDVFQTPIHLTHTINSADILLESHFGPSIFNAKKWKYSIFFSGEAVSSKPLPRNIDEYTFCMGSQKTNNNFISCPLYLAYDYCSPSSYPTQISSIPSKTICSVISSLIPESYRYTLLEQLHKNGIVVDNAGKYKNNIGYTIPGAYYDKPIIDFQKQYRLVLALENTVLDDYITEKIITPLRSGTIPVYFGSDKIDTYFNIDRFVKINVDTIHESIDEIKRLLTDDIYWLKKVNQPIFNKSTKECINHIIHSMKTMLNIRPYNIDIICNLSIENNRLKTLQPIINFYNVQPSYTVWGDDAKNHELYSKFYNHTTNSAISLAINHITLIRKYKNTNKFLIIFESDVIPLYDLSYIDTEIKNIIKEMKDNTIDFTFLGKGCFDNINSIPSFIKLIQITNKLYTTEYSRCTESYIISPKGISAFLDFIDTTNIPLTAIDFIFNYFFKFIKSCKSCWIVPELFKQGTWCGIYNRTISNSKLPDEYKLIFS